MTPDDQLPTPMRALFSQFSGLIGILTFVNQMLASTPVEKALLTGVGAGLAVYVVLLLGDVVIQRILDQAAASGLPEQQTTPVAPPAQSDSQSQERASKKDADAKAA